MESTEWMVDKVRYFAETSKEAGYAHAKRLKINGQWLSGEIRLLVSARHATPHEWVTCNWEAV